MEIQTVPKFALQTDSSSGKAPECFKHIHSPLAKKK